jgi:hypothetical protein
MLDELGIVADYTHAGPQKKGHQHFKDLSTDLPRPYERILVLIRDPRDATVSNYHQSNKRAHESHRIVATISELIRDPRIGLEKAARFNLLWAEFASTHNNAMVVSYEDLKADTIGLMTRIAAFFEAAVTPQQIAEVVARNEFSRMQERERSGEFGKIYGRPLMPRDPSDPSSFKVRKGKVGSHREELSPEDAAYCDAKLAELDYFDRIQRLTRPREPKAAARAGA